MYTTYTVKSAPMVDLLFHLHKEKLLATKKLKSFLQIGRAVAAKPPIIGVQLRNKLLRRACKSNRSFAVAVKDLDRHVEADPTRSCAKCQGSG